jgi:hypothetical protein
VTALVFLSDGALDPGAFRESAARFEVVARACDPEPARRFGSVGLFCRAWHSAKTA